MIETFVLEQENIKMNIKRNISVINKKIDEFQISMINRVNVIKNMHLFELIHMNRQVESEFDKKFSSLSNTKISSYKLCNYQRDIKKLTEYEKNYRYLLKDLYFNSSIWLPQEHFLFKKLFSFLISNYNKQD